MPLTQQYRAVQKLMDKLSHHGWSLVVIWLAVDEGVRFAEERDAARWIRLIKASRRFNSLAWRRVLTPAQRARFAAWMLDPENQAALGKEVKDARKRRKRLRRIARRREAAHDPVAGLPVTLSQGTAIQPPDPLAAPLRGVTSFSGPPSDGFHGPRRDTLSPRRPRRDVIRIRLVP